MPWFSVYGSVRQAIQDLIAPEIQKLHGEIKGLEGKIEGLDGKIQGLDGKIQGLDGKIQGLDGKIQGLDSKIQGVEARIQGLEAKFEGFRGEVNATFEAVKEPLGSVEATVKENSRKIDHFIEERVEAYMKSIDSKWHEALDIHERLAALEAKLETR